MKKAKKNVKMDFNDIAKLDGVGAVKNTLDNSIPYREWKNGIEKNMVEKSKEMDLNIVKKIMRKDPGLISSKLYDTLFKKPEINLNTATKLIELEQKSSSAKYLSSYNHIQKDLSMQKSKLNQLDNQKIVGNRRSIEPQKNLNIQDTQKNLAKTEKEIY